MRPCVPRPDQHQAPLVTRHKALPRENSPLWLDEGVSGGGQGREVGNPRRQWVHGHSLVRFLLTRLYCFAEKMVFVGFKGSFRPTWVTLDTEDHHAKIFQVVPIPVVRKKKL